MKKLSKTLAMLLALAMLFVGGLAAYTFVWDLGDVGVGLMTVFNIIVIVPMAGQALRALQDYERKMRERGQKGKTSRFLLKPGRSIISLSLGSKSPG